MISVRNSLGGLGPRLLAGLIVCLAPTLATAQDVIFKNDCNDAVVVQSESVIKGVMRRDRPFLLRAGASTPRMRFDSDKTITIYDGKNPNRILYQGSVRFSAMNRLFSIMPVRPPMSPPRVELRQMPTGS